MTSKNTEVWERVAGEVKRKGWSISIDILTELLKKGAMKLVGIE